tara:strand:+ start:488 stop:706 length:219 start_codon:yes stop_codon:yes gene_type:complete
MQLKRKDVKVGDLLKGICNVSRHEVNNFIQDDCFYVVVDPIGLSDNGIWIINLKTGEKIHANARYFLKTDKN